MARTIKVHGLGGNGSRIEVRDVELDEARRILEDARKPGWFVVNAKTQEIIWEIGPEIEEIIVYGPIGGG